MSIFAVINNATNICDNVVVGDDTLGPWTPPADHYTVNIDDKEVGIGWAYDLSTSAWTEPTPPPSPEAPASPSITELQAQLAALSAQIAALSDVGKTA